MKEYLMINPEALCKYTPFLKNDHKYTFLDHVEPYLGVHSFYCYLNSLEEFQLKNIWNHIHKQWTLFHNNSTSDRGYMRSPYSKKHTSYHHSNIQGETLNSLLRNFIQEDCVISIFVMNALLYHGIPSLRKYPPGTSSKPP